MTAEEEKVFYSDLAELSAKIVEKTCEKCATLVQQLMLDHPEMTGMDLGYAIRKMAYGVSEDLTKRKPQ